jgi:serine/threonine protein kinase
MVVIIIFPNITSNMGGGVSSFRKGLIYKHQKPSPLDASSYSFGFIIGMGSFASVQLATYAGSKKMLAMKEIKLVEHDAALERTVDKFASEMNALKVVAGRHPNVINLEVAFHNDSSCFIGLEYLNGGDLRFYLTQGFIFNPEQVAYIVLSLGSALHFLHSNHILHRDVKPENIVLSQSGVPVLTDFGECHIESADCFAPLCNRSSGSWPYLAPEILTPSHRHSCQSDWWSLGIMMFELLFRKRPFAQHCSKDMIYFTENHYKMMWDRLDRKKKVVSKSAKHESGRVDWEAIAHCDEDQRRSVMSFAKYDITLPEDKTLPVELKVPIPAVTAGNLPVSDACKDLLWGLLDVRIPLRLGSGSNYSTFTNHSWFGESNICIEEREAQQSPLHPDPKKVLAQLRQRYAEATYLRINRDGCCNRIPANGLSPSVKEKLRQMKYVSPSLNRDCDSTPLRKERLSNSGAMMFYDVLEVTASIPQKEDETTNISDKYPHVVCQG